MEDWLINWTGFILSNTHVEYKDLKIKAGAEWYKYMFETWSQNSDLGKKYMGEKNNMNNNPGDNTMTTMSPTDLENERFFKTEASDYNPAVREKNNATGETTIEFPKAHQPEQYNPNKPALDWITFKFEQESNCVDGGSPEQLVVEAKSSLGIDGDGGAFYVLKTEQWAISDIDDMLVMLKRVKAALDATKPTSIHVK